MPLSETLKRLRKEKGWTQQRLADESSVNRDIIAQVETKKSGFGPENQALIAKALGVTSSTLDYTKEENETHTRNQGHPGTFHNVKIEELIKPTVSPRKVLLYLSQLPEKDAIDYIPYYDVEITAGRIEQYFDDVEEVPEGYVYAPQYRGCVMCNVKGNSMYNLIYPGARLYVYQLHDKKYIDFGQVYLIVLKSMRVLKYIRRHPNDDTKVILSSHNKDHDDWDIERADIINLFQVKGFENQIAM